MNTVPTDAAPDPLPSRAGRWVGAARLPTLPAALTPVLVGSGLAAGDGAFRGDAFAAALIVGLAIQVAANFANDASDAARGADTPDRIGPTRMVASGLIPAPAMWKATVVAVAVAVVAGLYLWTIAGPVVLAIGAASILAMLTYVGGPIPYGYRGLGEVAVFVFFGLVATVGTRFVHDGTVPIDAWVLGTVMGLLAAGILVANNLRDLRTDAAAGKRTLAVLVGESAARRLYGSILVGAVVVVVVGAVSGITPPLTGLAVLWLPFAAPLIRRASTAIGPNDLAVLLGETARFQLVVGATLALTAAASG